MPILAVPRDPAAIDVRIDESAISVTLADGREITAPMAWFPKLRDATREQRDNWRLIGRGEGIHWADLDEDVSIGSLLGLPT